MELKMAIYCVIILGLFNSGGISNINSDALSIWTESVKDFENGLHNNTVVNNDSISLTFDPILPNNWTKVSDLPSPPPLSKQSIVYDPINRLHILFGGGNYYYHNETWIYNYSDNHWKLIGPSGLIPTARTGQAMVYDTTDNSLILFGGYNGFPLSDTFTYNPINNTWTKMDPGVSPSGRMLHSMVYDSINDLIYLFGGGRESGTDIIYNNDTWMYDYHKNLWSYIKLGNAPCARFGQSMIFDPEINQIILFGGQNNTDFFNDTWAFNTITNNWSKINNSAYPPARSGAAMAIDLLNGEIILLGGQNRTILYTDMWTFNITNGKWIEKNGISRPSERVYASMDYDSSENRLFLFGGSTGNKYQDDFWGYDPFEGKWEVRGKLETPVPREGGSFSYDYNRDVGVLFGGMSEGILLNDTWIYNGSENRWIEEFPAHSPSHRWNAEMCYDRDSNQMVLLGGSELGYIWIYNHSSSDWMSRETGFSSLTEIAINMVYDSNNHIVVVFGINNTETWTYNLSIDLWINRTGIISPRSRVFSEMVFDEENDLIVLFGGIGHSTLTGMNDTWILDTKTFIWSLSPSTSAPSKRCGHAMCYDYSLKKTLLFGGIDNTGHHLGDTWFYNSSTNLWEIINAMISPPPRIHTKLIYDMKLHITYLFGGVSSIDLGDMWLYNSTGYFSNGIYISSPKEIADAAYYGSIEWTSSVPDGTLVKLQIRTRMTLVELEMNQFAGPDGTVDSYFTKSGQIIPAVYNAQRWIQYRAILSTSCILLTPALLSVKINYNIISIINITSPIGGENWTGIQNITWIANDKDNDSLLFDIHLENEHFDTLLVGSLGNETRQWSWDTKTIESGSYRIRIIAYDKNPLIPLSVYTTSGFFIIRHPIPPPNHLPHITLISPLNNSYLLTNSTRLVWMGSDLDGESLTYNIQYSPVPFSQNQILNITTTATFMDLSELTDNITYYWTVNATDNKSNGTDTPVDIWCFTIRLPPANIPVRINSSPSNIAFVGLEYKYNISSIDEDGDIPIFSLVSGPALMTLDSSTGKLRWIPISSDIGDHTISIQVSDGRGSLDYQTFTITVKDILPVIAPKCAITFPTNGLTVNGTIPIQGTATNGSFPLNVIKIRIDNGTWFIAVGLENWTYVLNTKNLVRGPHRIEAKAFAANLSSETASADFIVRNFEPSISIGNNQWCLTAAIITIIVGINVIVMLRKRIGKQG
jgi:hypothetical protein